MAADDEDKPWTRQLLVGLGALAAVSLLIGAIVSVVALGAAKVTGIGSTQSGPTAKASLYIPPLTEIPSQPQPASPNVPSGGSTSASPSTSSSPSASLSNKPKHTRSAHPRGGRISLQAFPSHPKSGGRVNLTGTDADEGARLQVQRLEGGSWTDFPTNATVQGGIFETYIITSRTGVNKLRVYDKHTHKASNAVRVVIR